MKGSVWTQQLNKAKETLTNNRFKCLYCGEEPWAQQSEEFCSLSCICGHHNPVKRKTADETISQWNATLKEIGRIMVSDACVTLKNAPTFIHHPYAYIRYVAKEKLAGRKHSVALYSRKEN